MNESEERAVEALRKIKVFADSAVLGNAQLTDEYVMDTDNHIHCWRIYMGIIWALTYEGLGLNLPRPPRVAAGTDKYGTPEGGENMKYLTQFLRFNCGAFFRGKTLQIVACGPLADYTTKQIIGSKLTAVIVKDETEYHTKAGEQASNLYEKVTIKVPGKTLTLAPGTVIDLVNPTAVVYGEYRNQLSVTAEDVHEATTGKA